jgi:hypothetical protein
MFSVRYWIGPNFVFIFLGMNRFLYRQKKDSAFRCQRLRNHFFPLCASSKILVVQHHARFPKYVSDEVASRATHLRNCKRRVCVAFGLCIFSSFATSFNLHILNHFIDDIQFASKSPCESCHARAKTTQVIR